MNIYLRNNPRGSKYRVDLHADYRASKSQFDRPTLHYSRHCLHGVYKHIYVYNKLNQPILFLESTAILLHSSILFKLMSVVSDAST